MENHHSRRTHALLLLSVPVALGMLAAGCARHDAGHAEAALDAHDAGHAAHVAGGAAGGGAAVARLALDDGRKWETDAPLRAGMAAIRAAFDAEHAAIDAGSASDAQYDALAGRVDAEVKEIVRNCRLPPAADANLHLVVADLLRGAQEMRRADPARTRHDGAALVHGALQAYGEFFDDPGLAGASQLP